MHAIRLFVLLSLGGGAEVDNAGTHLLADYETDEEAVRWGTLANPRGDRQAQARRRIFLDALARIGVGRIT